MNEKAGCVRKLLDVNIFTATKHRNNFSLAKVIYIPNTGCFLQGFKLIIVTRKLKINVFEN